MKRGMCRSWGCPIPRRPVPKEPKHCQDYQVTAAGRPVKAKWEAEPQPKRGAAPDQRFDGLRGWFVSELSFAANEEKPVLIRFRSGYAQSGFHVSDQGSMSSANFTYRLSTAACWAGSIGKGRIVLKPVGIDPSELKVLKPVNRFRKEGDSWVWNFENLEPTLADDINIEVVPVVVSQHGEGRLNHGRNGRWYYVSTDYTAKASSVLAPEDGKTYGPENLASYRDERVVRRRAGPGRGRVGGTRPESREASVRNRDLARLPAEPRVVQGERPAETDDHDPQRRAPGFRRDSG